MSKKKVKKAGERRSLYAAVFSILFAVTGAIALVFTQAAGSGSITLAADRTNLGLNDIVTVTVTEESAEPVNAVQADLTYNPAVLQFVSVDTSTSAFNLAVQSSGSGGKVTIARGSVGDTAPRPLSGRQTVGTVKFKAIAAGTTSVGVASTSLLLSNNTNTNIIASTTGVNLSIKDTTPPSVPSGLVATGATLNSVALRWNASTDNVGTTGYNIYRNGAKVGTATGTTYTDAGLSPGTAYSYRVAAYDRDSNVSAQSAPLTASTLTDAAAPSVPSGITLTANDLTSITLRWNASTDNVGTTGYNIYRNGAKIATSGTASYKDAGLKPGTSYSYTVSAYDARNNTSAQSTGATLSTKSDVTVPSTPTNLKAQAISSTGVNLTWTASTDNIGVSGYEVYRNNIKIATVSTTAYNDRGLTPETTYQYKVQAVDPSNNRSVAATVSATVRYKAGDVNNDGLVDMLDYSIIATNWGVKTGASRAMGDLGGPSGRPDGAVDLFDLSIVATNWGPQA